MNIPLFLIPIICGIVAQGLKPLLNRNLKSTLEVAGYKLPRYGGMPSAHTAFAFSLATLAGVTEGWGSTAFAITVAITIFIMDDALRLRIFLGRHGQAISRLVKLLPEEKRGLFEPLEQRLGHHPSEVVAGAVLGIALSGFLLWIM